MRSTAYVTVRPRYGLSDIVGLMLREWLLVIVVFLAVFVVGAILVLTLPKIWTARASVFVGLGQEYVYQPRVGDAARGALPEPGEIVQSEAAILDSTAVKQRVVQTLGPDALLGTKGASGAAGREAAAVRVLSAGLNVGAAPGNGILSLSYEAEDPATAARVLNAVIDEYLMYRREIFMDPTTPLLRGQRERFEDELARADDAYRAFLSSNDIGDFATARSTLAAAYQSVFTERLQIEAQLNQTAQRLSTLVSQQAATPAEIALQQDLNISAQDQILQLRTEREQMLSRYQSDAQPVRDIEARIAQLQAYVATGTAVGAKEVRTGPNPIWVELETSRVNTRAERDSLAARLASLNTQLGDIRSRQSRLNQLESRNASLSGEREVLTASIREFQQRETQSRADNELARNGADNVTVIERAVPPSRAASMRAPLMILVFLFAGFTALCAGLIRIFTRRGFATPASAGRTLELPVLAVAPVKTW